MPTELVIQGRKNFTCTDDLKDWQTIHVAGLKADRWVQVLEYLAGDGGIEQAKGFFWVGGEEGVSLVATVTGEAMDSRRERASYHCEADTLCKESVLIRKAPVTLPEHLLSNT